MADLNTTLSELSTPLEAPNTDIQSLIGGVDISSFQERLTPILDNPDLKKKLIASLKDNQPISGGLQLSKIIKKIEETQVETKETQVETKETQVETKETQVETKETQVETKETQVETKETQVEGERARLQNAAKIATKDVNDAVKNIDAGIKNPVTQSKIATEISSELQDIQGGKISGETKSFLDSIGATTPETIQSPTVQDILRARIATGVYLKNQKIIKDENPGLTEQFGVLETNKHALGYKSEIVASSVGAILSDYPKDDKNVIVSTVNSLTKGAPDTLITREGDRLSWKDPSGSQYEIDMAVRPPKLTQSLGKLSLSRTEQRENPEAVTLQQAVTAQKITVERTGSDIRKSLSNSGVYGFDPANYSPDQIRQLFTGESISAFQEKLNNANTPEQQAALKQELGTARISSSGKLNQAAIQYMEYIIDDRIQLRATGIGGGVGESVSSRDWRDKLSSLKDLQSGGKLEQYAREQEILEQREKELGLVQSAGVESFDMTAQATLERLTTLGLGQIGQDNLDTLIQGLAARDGQRGIWENGRINMDDMRVREMQLQDLRQVSTALQVARRNNPGAQDENSLGIVYVDIARMIRGNEEFRKMWNTPNQLARWISQQSAPRVAGEEKV